MGEQEPMTRTMDISEIGNQISSLVDAISRGETRI
jgi:hypothetical protein